MRIITIKDLNLNGNFTEGEFYNEYLKKLSNKKNVLLKEDEKPEMKYEIVKLDSFGGKILLLDKKIIKSNDLEGQELFFDFDIARVIYEKYIDLKNLEKEKVEIDNDESKIIDLVKEIDDYKAKDLKKFNQKNYDYTILVNSKLYSEYKLLKEENSKLKVEINNLKENSKILNTSDSNSSFIMKIKKIFKMGEN